MFPNCGRLPIVFVFTLLLVVVTTRAALAEETNPLALGVAGHAFDHLGAIGEQAEAAAASGFNIIYATGCGGAGYEGLPPADKLAEMMRQSAEYNTRARAQGIKVILGYV